EVASGADTEARRGLEALQLGPAHGRRILGPRLRADLGADRSLLRVSPAIRRGRAGGAADVRGATRRGPSRRGSAACVRGSAGGKGGGRGSRSPARLDRPAAPRG